MLVTGAVRNESGFMVFSRQVGLAAWLELWAQSSC